MYCTTSSRAGVLLMYLYYLLLINLGSWQIVANQFGLMLPGCQSGVSPWSVLYLGYLLVRAHFELSGTSSFSRFES